MNSLVNSIGQITIPNSRKKQKNKQWVKQWKKLFRVIGDVVKEKPHHEWEVYFCTLTPISVNLLAMIVVKL